MTTALIIWIGSGVAFALWFGYTLLTDEDYQGDE